jgi:hypothetical protein
MLGLALSTLLTVTPAHPELGRVRWLRDFDVALATARTSKKPVLVLFDEVPGCDTVRGFGREVLSDPAIVERIERDFVPVAIFNNVEGKDRAVLEAFREPTWNNPVVRILDADQKALAPRFDGPYSLAAFTRLLDAVKPAPAPALESLTVSAHCFWECEAQLGRLDAVRATRAGFLLGEEVVEVQFDARVMDRATLLKEAQNLECSNRVFSRTDAEHAVARSVLGDRAVRTDKPLQPSEKDTKYYLKQRGTPETGLSSLEATRANSALRFGNDPQAAVAACRMKK